jgi:hypothetical protein
MSRSNTEAFSGEAGTGSPSENATRHRMRAAAVLLAAGTLLAGCSDIYFDRRETIVPTTGDAIAANRVTHMVDPWPPSSANRNIAFNGEVMQRAHERYREGRVIPPVNATTSSVAYARAQATVANSNSQVQSATSNNGPTPSGWAPPQSAAKQP